MLQETCTHAEARSLLPKLLEAWELTAENMTPKQISGCLWALGWLDPGAKDSRGALVSVRNEIAFALAEMRMKELSEGLWGFAALEFGDQ
ncbi:USP, partial [Symbiodinium natans]